MPRDLLSTQFRQVTEQAVSNDGAILQSAAELGIQIQQQGDDAKMVKGQSDAQLQLAQLDNQYQIDFEGDPLGGKEKYEADRQRIYSNIGKTLPAYRRRDWATATSGISGRSDLSRQNWVNKQTRVNMVGDINDTMQSNLGKANSDGRNFGVSTENEIDMMGAFASSAQNLSDFATKNLGETTSDGMMETYSQDYLKSFISGVAETSPSKALGLLDKETVRESFSDHKQYDRFKSSLEARQRRFNKANKQGAEAMRMAQTNQLMTKMGQMNYPQLQAHFSEFNTSPEAQAFYTEVNGYANLKRRLGPSERSDAKNQFYMMMTNVIGQDDMNNNDISILQESIYAGMRKQVLTKKEGFSFLNNILGPVITQQQERAKQFETGEWNPFNENLGLDTLNEEINNLSGITNIEKPTEQQLFIHNKNTNLMYDVYLQTLGREANARKTSVAGLSDLPFEEEKMIYGKALSSAKEALIRQSFPSIAGMDELPTTVVTPISNVNMTNADIDNMTEAELDKFLAGL